jgi:predicted permease
LSNLISLFWNNLLPIFIIAGIGYLVGKWLEIKPKTLSQVIFYIFSPALIFDLISNSQLQAREILQIGSITVVVTLLLTLLAYLSGKALKLPRKLLAASILVVILPNAGNYGLSVNLLSFGESALAYASIYFSFSVILMYTLGVVVASLGSVSFRQALLAILKVPSLYAVLLAFIFLAFDLQLPAPMKVSVSLLSDATIPAMLVLLGLQILNLTRNQHFKALSIAAGLRLLISPALGLGIALLAGLHGAALQAVVTESAMPSAVTNTVLATEYDVEPGFVASVVFYTTILSPITVTPILALLS